MATAITLRSTARHTTHRRRSWRRTPETELAPAADTEFTWDTRNPGSAGFNLWIAAVGHRVDRSGLSGSARDVENLIGVARKLGVATVAVDVLADPAEPDPARVRALSVVVSALATA